jgi:2-succinyl-6-hydroxy-2,4-cyclohexadiene-1-carboxylate synthase
MFVEADSVKINIEKLRVNENASKSLFLLHGFTGSSSDWLNVCFQFDTGFNVYAIDLIGHGKSDSPNDVSYYSSGSQANQIKCVIEKFKGEKNVLLGYSMGGRLALTNAISYPDLIDGLILESSTAGIDDENEQKKRTERDTKLAEMIMTKPIEEFISSWMDQELFGTLKRFSNSKLDEMKKEKSKSSRTGLANSLRGFSTGLMKFSKDDLKCLKFPVLLLSGQLDSKFTKINSNLQKQFANAKHSVVKTSGHNTHLEEPKHFIQIVNKFLQKI